MGEFGTWVPLGCIGFMAYGRANPGIENGPRGNRAEAALWECLAGLETPRAAGVGFKGKPKGNHPFLKDL